MKNLVYHLHLFFVPPAYREDEVVYRKAKIFVNTTLITAVFALFFLGNAIAFEMPMATVSMIVCATLFFSFAWMLKLGVLFNVCTNCYIGLGVIATTWDAYFAGGLRSIHTPWFVFPAIGAILIGTVSQGRMWLIISVAIVLCFGIAAISGYSFPNELGPDYENWMATSAYAGLIVILFIVVLVVENAYLKSLKRLNSALDSLRKSQEQLVHQEKLALLGQMVAGIAHEMQNPLNFVNNFSSVSGELLEEWKEAKTQEEKNEIIRMLTENLSKIETHGKRADRIVKEMLMHSRMQPGQKELTDINRLCEEAIMLAYQNAKVNNNGIATGIEKKYAITVLKTNIIPHDIARVVLNVLDNAIYAVSQKRRIKAEKKEAYEPLISLSTQSADGQVIISIKDNGMGIPKPIAEKIFQPFFTTKPPKDGTGLGLSISYDIVKAHGGDIQVESREGEGTTFTIKLPL